MSPQAMKKEKSAKPAAKSSPSPRAPKAPPSRAGERMTGADMVVQVLAEQGVDTVFGYSGGAILPTYDAIFRFNKAAETNGAKPINLVVPANEQGAGFMAAGYSRASGRVGVAIVTSGPGATNTVTPVRDCMSDSIPMIVICGQVPTAAIGSDAFQEAPVFNIMNACAKHVFLVKNPDELEETIRAAFWIAKSGRPGPVVIDVPKDVQNWTGAFKGEGMLPLRGYRHRIAALERSRINKEKAATFFRMLAESDRPLIYAGGGVINSGAADALRAFTKTFRIPVVTTLLGIGSMDTSDDLALHMLGMHGTPYANYAVEDCDFLISVGARFDDRVAGKVAEFAPKAKYVAHIDIDAAEIGKVKAVCWSHVGDANQALKDLKAYGEKAFKKDYTPWVEHVKALKKKHPLNYDRKNKLIQPYYVLERLNEITKGEAIITVGVGQHQMWAAQYCQHHKPRHFVTSGSMGTMGFGLPAAIGAALARPGATVIDIDGDGSLRMNFGEMETATSYGVPVKILLLNNEGDGMVRQWQRLYFGDRFIAIDKSLRKKDFCKAADADGFGFARRIERNDQVDAALRAWLAHDGPALLEVKIDPFAFVYPMVGPGMSYKDMVTGEWITARPKAAAAPKETEKIDMTKVPDLF